MKQNLFPRLQKIGTGIAAGAFAFVWWTLLYPELCFPEDTYEIVCEAETDISAGESHEQLLWADKDEIIIRSRLLEWIKEHHKQ